MEPITIYLAGFDVFRGNAKEIGEQLKAKCAERGYIGLYPLDNEIKNTDKDEIPQTICFGNLKYIDRSQVVIANLNPFRGPECDSGTAFECGYAKGKQKIVLAYTELIPMKDKVKKYYPPITHSADTDRFIDKDGYSIEDFGLPLNLMLSQTADFIGTTFDGCLDYLESIRADNA